MVKHEYRSKKLITFEGEVGFAFRDAGSKALDQADRMRVVKHFWPNCPGRNSDEPRGDLNGERQPKGKNPRERERERERERPGTSCVYATRCCGQNGAGYTSIMGRLLALKICMVHKYPGTRSTELHTTKQGKPG
jgi:hypothetical protein